MKQGNNLDTIINNPGVRSLIELLNAYIGIGDNENSSRIVKELIKHNYQLKVGPSMLKEITPPDIEALVERTLNRDKLMHEILGKPNFSVILNKEFNKYLTSNPWNFEDIKSHLRMYYENVVCHIIILSNLSKDDKLELLKTAGLSKLEFDVIDQKYITHTKDYDYIAKTHYISESDVRKLKDAGFKKLRGILNYENILESKNILERKTELHRLRAPKEIEEIKDDKGRPIYEVDVFYHIRRSNPEIFSGKYWDYTQVILYSTHRDQGYKKFQVLLALMRRDDEDINQQIKQNTSQSLYEYLVKIVENSASESKIYMPMSPQEILQFKDENGESIYTLDGIRKIISQNPNIFPYPTCICRAQIAEYIYTGTKTSNKKALLSALKHENDLEVTKYIKEILHQSKSL